MAGVGRELETDYFAAAAALRAYLLAGSDRALAEYRSQLARAIDASAELRRLLDDESELAQLAAVSGAARQWSEDVIGPLIAKGQPTDAPRRVIDAYRASRAAPKFRSLATAVGVLRSHLDASADSAAGVSDPARARVTRFMAISGAAAASSGLLLLTLATFERIVVSRRTGAHDSTQIQAAHSVSR